MIIVKNINNRGMVMGGAQIPSAPAHPPPPPPPPPPPKKKKKKKKNMLYVKQKDNGKLVTCPIGKILATPLRNTVYVVILAVVYFCEFRKSDLAKKFPLQFMSIYRNEKHQKNHEFLAPSPKPQKYLYAKIMAYTVMINFVHSQTWQTICPCSPLWY